MTHVKALLVDELWAVIGTTNFDNRSFEHNDEVNVAFRDRGVTARIAADLEADLRNAGKSRSTRGAGGRCGKS